MYGSFSSRATNYQFTENGSAGGDFGWIDNIYDNMWLSDTIQNSLATFIATVGRIPYNNEGTAQTKAVVIGVMVQATNNGVVENGNTFDDIQRQAVIEAIGIDATPYLTSQGYYIYIPKILPSQRIAREPVPITILYTNGGAINSFTVNSVFVQ